MRKIPSPPLPAPHCGSNSASRPTGSTPGTPCLYERNAVVMMENINTETEKDSQGESQWAVIEKAAFPWQHVRKMGEDMVATEIVLPPGTCIGPYDLGARWRQASALGVVISAALVFPSSPAGRRIVPLVDAREEDLRTRPCAARIQFTDFFGHDYGGRGAKPPPCLLFLTTQRPYGPPLPAPLQLPTWSFSMPGLRLAA